MKFGETNAKILTRLDGLVSGHTEAKKALISLVNRSVTRHFQKWEQHIHKEHLLTPHKVLLLGQSGTGKTHLVDSLQSILDFPLIHIDATKLNPTGASGGIKAADLEKMIWDKAKEYCITKKGYYHSVDGTVDKMVIFVDEIDKLGRSFDSSGNWNNHVQSNFLTLFDNKEEFAGVSFIFAGAFVDLTKNDTTKSIGFNHIEHKQSGLKTIDQRIVESGLLPELVGRLTNIVQLDKFTLEDYVNILRTVLLPKKQIEMAYFEITDTNLSELTILRMCKHAESSGQGIRALKRELDREFADLEFDFEDSKYRLTYGSDDAINYDLLSDEEGADYDN